jgi:hypothetical protein
MMLDLGHALGGLAPGVPAWLAGTTSLGRDIKPPEERGP